MSTPAPLPERLARALAEAVAAVADLENCIPAQRAPSGTEFP